MSKLVTDVKSYAQLLKSVSAQDYGLNQRRPLTPVECAEKIQQLIDEEGDDLAKIAQRLNLGKPTNMSNMYKKRDTSQVRVFLNLLKVSEKSRNLAGWASDGYPKIPFSTMSQLSTMSFDEQDMIIQSIFSSKDHKKILGTEDIKKIKKWRRENPDLSVKECIEKILKLKTVRITNIVVCEIREKLNQFIKSDKDYNAKLLDILRNNLNGEFHNLDAGNSVIAISMDDVAYKIFHDSQYNKKISYTKFLEKFLNDKIG